jgi:CheY-like chemotaxis protein
MRSRRVLIAEDEPTNRRLLQAALLKWGYDVIICADGHEAWQALEQPEGPSLALLDWLMPGLDGVELCKRIRETPEIASTYVIMLTTRAAKEDIVEGLRAGADDYVIKPYHAEELRARLLVGMRIVTLQKGLVDRVRELEAAAANIKRLQRLLPICSYCKRIRDDRNYWRQLEQYLGEHADVHFTHGVCPECFERAVGEPDATEPVSAPPAPAPSPTQGESTRQLRITDLPPLLELKARVTRPPQGR